MEFHTKTATRSRLDQYQRVRQFSDIIAAPLETEDFVIQTMPDVSPTKWHLAHTTWFFEQFVLKAAAPDYKVFHPEFCYLFNSYYNAIGERHPRAHRGVLSRPTVSEIFEYRRYVDEQLSKLLTCAVSAEIDTILEIGIHHEQQHQELMLTDIKHVLSCNPLRPAYRVDLNEFKDSKEQDLTWSRFDGGIKSIGHNAEQFHFDNELPRHEILVRDFEFSNRLITNREYLNFIDDGGYSNPALWLSEGWDAVRGENWQAPLYWEQIDGDWHEFTLGGMRPICLDSPVTHISFFEADAFARWHGSRLPLESEWETVAIEIDDSPGNFADRDYLHPIPVENDANLTPQQVFGDVWEWTASPYVAYPGYQPPEGAVGEYNGKFMSSQWVLRGGSCVTSESHIRPTYRNFFHPDKRWQFSGIRLAR